MRAESGLRALLAAVLIGFVGLLAAVVALRFGHPYELEWMEGGMLAHALRVLAPEPLYASPSLDFVAYMYPPLYYYATAALVAVAGEGFGPLRALSVVAAAGSLVLLYRIARRETGSPLAGCVAAGTFAAAYDATGAWLDLARQDSLYLFFLLLAVERLRSADDRRAAAEAGLALAAAFFVKQSIVLMAVPVWLALLRTDPARALVAAVAAGAPILGGVALLDAAYDGWYWYYTVTVPSGHPSELDLALGFWTRDLLAVYGIALAATVWLGVDQWRTGPGARSWLWPALAVGAIASSWSVRSLVGAHLNNLFPVYAVLSLTLALAFDRASRHGGRRAIVAPLAVLLQLGLLAYDPRPLVPSAADREAGDRLVERLAAIDGEVFVPNHGYLARRAGKREYAHTLAIDNLLLDDLVSDARRDLELDFLAHFQRRAFAAVVIESDGRYGEFAQRFYGTGRRLFERDDVFWPVSGGRIRPQMIYFPPD